jgi:hypothetical protein
MAAAGKRRKFAVGDVVVEFPGQKFDVEFFVAAILRECPPLALYRDELIRRLAPLVELPEAMAQFVVPASLTPQEIQSLKHQIALAAHQQARAAMARGISAIVAVIIERHYGGVT